MLRNLLGAILGYVVMVIVVLAGIAIAWRVLGGGSGAFAGESPDPSTAWLILSVLFGFAAAVAGGFTARKIGRSQASIKIFIGLILALGAYFAITADSSYAKRPKVDKPVAEMSFQEAGQHAKNPAWYNFGIPLVGVAGGLLGARSRDS